MPYTKTRAGTQTSTLSKIVPVARKIEADLLNILDTYGCGPEEWGIAVMHDVRVLMDEEVIERIYMSWTQPGTNEVLDAYSYRVIIGGLGLADDRSGNIRYRPELDGADFHFRVRYNDRWQNLAPADKADIQERLSLSWGPCGWLDYSKGTWQNDHRTYSNDGFGVNRERFVR
jgi:hypothetical protein